MLEIKKCPTTVRCYACEGKQKELYKIYVGDEDNGEEICLCKGCSQELSQKLSAMLLKDSLAALRV